MSQRLTLIVAGAPDQRTGGYIYDAQIVAALREQGVTIDVIGLPGRFPDADETASLGLGETLAAQPDGARVIIDGLAMGALPDIVRRHTHRLDITALLHHPLGDEQGLRSEDQQRLHRSELAGIASVARVIVTSRFTERRLRELANHYALPMNTPISVVEPGVAAAPISPAAEPDVPIRLLCVGTLTPRKGQDVLVNALAGLSDLNWQCDCYGGARDVAFTQRVQQLIDDNGLSGRVVLHGECDAATLEAAYQSAHALLLPSWYEGYGMVVTEALAHGLPVITTTGGALKDTLPEGAGLSVAPGDVNALKAALQDFIADAALRTTLRAGAAEARGNLHDWQAAGAAFAKALQLPPSLAAGSQFQADWLTLRERVDAHARSKELTQAAAVWLVSGVDVKGRPSDQVPPTCIADLGCGRGSNMQFLAPQIPNPQHWMLFDHDAGLLNEALERAAALRSAKGQPVSVESHCVSLTTLKHPALEKARLVTASALLDLVSRAWIEALVSQCVRHRQGVLMAMSVTGAWCFTDRQLTPVENDEDCWVQSLFVAHQQRDKGLGDALGGDAHGVLMEAFKQQGFQVSEAETPWQLNASDPAVRPLMHALVAGWADAATEQAPEEAANRISQWRDRRLQAVEEGAVGILVSHRDLLALPADEA
ncbi:glycosyltransferase [Halomonas sp. 7T]|uniref:glycosyltransferase n=1 Tax=Halomonas sp. 7T TaxID=2893469 RepID=UPI0021D8ED40|nr:glycosyltransferase [Halomonas sp. 7T]UXZ53251.1 glycosyltransferase [Halomonas sp. 7T]